MPEDNDKIKRVRTALVFIGAIVAALVVCCFIFFFLYIHLSHKSTSSKQFVVPLDASSTIQVERELKTDGFIKHAWFFAIIFHIRAGAGTIQPGGYTISMPANSWSVASALIKKPDSVWVVIPPGLRKEQTADVLAKALGWTSAEEQEWITTDTVTPDYTEGVFFPDSYLIPRSDTSAQVAKRLIDQFEEETQTYQQEALAQNIKWTTLIKVASIIQREAAGTSDMPLVSGIIWNRLLANMPLDVDATLQYARGNTGAGWWAPVSAADKQIDSPYNTYLNAGLPPTPIDSPGLDAIKAALYPQTTNCLYYLHDSSGNIHCSATYAGQQANIDTYLK